MLIRIVYKYANAQLTHSLFCVILILIKLFFLSNHSYAIMIPMLGTANMDHIAYEFIELLVLTQILSSMNYFA